MENLNTIVATKKFLWKDKTGRGFSNTLTLADLLAIEEDDDENDESLHEWAEYASVGDEWEDRTMKFTCIEA